MKSLKGGCNGNDQTLLNGAAVGHVTQYQLSLLTFTARLVKEGGEWVTCHVLSHPLAFTIGKDRMIKS